MTKEHHRQQEARRIWITPEQTKALLTLGFPKDAVAEMNYREAERMINQCQQLPDDVLKWESRFELPDMKGVTDAQSVYARSCRYKYLLSVPYVYERQATSQQKAVFIQTLTKLKAITDAVYWINKRDASLYEDFQQYLASLEAL